jgi:hypothetical protein
MIRRIVMLGIAGAVLAAAPASAFSGAIPHTKKTQLYMAEKVGRLTHSRVAHGSCTITAVPPRLNIGCTGGSATVVYQFAAVAPVVGKPSCAVSSTGNKPSVKVKASGSTITVTVSVSGQRNTQIISVSVNYYA